MKFDFEKAEREYITTKTSYRKLAEKYEVDQRYLARYAKKHEWVKKKDAYTAKVHQKSIEKAMKKDVDQLGDLKTATDTAIGVVMRYVSNLSEAEQDNSREMKDCVQMLKDLVNVKRDLYGILSKKDELALRQDSGNDGEHGVVFIPPVLEEDDDG